jgi:hypothetical protein
MKPKEFNNLIENLISKEIKKIILEEVSESKKEVYHIKCGGEPIDSFKTEEEAQSHLDIYKKDNPKKQYIIEKGVYESEDDMIDKLDEMGQELEEKENMKNPIKVKSLAEAILHAKKNNISEIKVNGETFDVDECWKNMEEEETQCDECGDNYMEEGSCPRCGKEVCECWGSEMKEEEPDEVHDDWYDDDNDTEDYITTLGSIGIHRKEKPEEECYECGDQYMEEETCPKCGKEVCECGTMEESKLIDVIRRVVKESTKGDGNPFKKVVNNPKTNTDSLKSGAPGITITKKAQTGSKKENDDYATEVANKIKKYLSFEGNDNPEFPKQIGKGEKMTIQTTDEENEYIEDTRGGGMQNLKYDHEPSEKFKERLKSSLEGDSKMGNPKKAANAVDTDLGQKMVKQIKRKEKKEDEFPMYNKDKQPVTDKKPKLGFVGVNESKTSMSSILEEEIKKMKNISNYNKKTQ